MSAMSQLSADTALAGRLKPLRRLTEQEQFLLDTAFLPLPALAAKSNAIIDAMMCEADEAKRGDLSRRLLVIDHIADLKFPGEFTSARRRAA